MYLSQNVSTRISLLRFPLIVGVVFIHTFQGGGGVFFGDNIVSYNGNSIAIFIQILFSEVLARTAVPLFFIMSGILFFKDFLPVWVCYSNKVGSRIKTILIPYLVWNSIVILSRYVTEFLPNSSVLLSGRNHLVSNYTLENILIDFFWSPIAYQFWFLRDLFIVVLLSPLFYWLAKKIGTLPFFAFSLFWLVDAPKFLLNLNWQTLVFFYLACLITIQGWNLERLDQRRGLIIFSYLFFALLVASIQTFLSISGQESLLVDIFAKEIVLLGVLAVWCSTKYILGTSLQQKLLLLAPFSFFVYAAHEPLLTVIRKLVYRAFPPMNPWLVVIYYFLLPIAVVSFLIFIARLLKAYFPRGYAVVTGGRVEKKTLGASASQLSP